MAKAKRYRHLTYEQRWQIYTLLKSEKFYSQKDRAKIIESTQGLAIQESISMHGKTSTTEGHFIRIYVAEERSIISAEIKQQVEVLYLIVWA